jgi:hypothetical protein
VLAVVLAHGVVDRGGAGLEGAAGLAEVYGLTFWWTLACTVLAVPSVFLMPGRTQAVPAPAAVPEESPQPVGTSEIINARSHQAEVT